MDSHFIKHLQSELKKIETLGLKKNETALKSAQGAHITLENGQKLLNFCTNNYLGLANHPEVIDAAIQGLHQYGFGLASVRFISGTQIIHRQLEETISHFLQTEDTLLYTSCFDANGGLFETLLESEDAIFSDELNHASIIDGIRLSKAERHRYKHCDVEDLEKRLISSKNARFKMIATDGVFSMDGTLAPLQEIANLRDCYQALLLVDDCHGVGIFGKEGKGTIENIPVDIVTGTLGKALGGAIGGYTSGKKEVIAYLRERSRPYLFSNSLPPAIVMATLQVFTILKREGALLRKKLHENTHYFRKKLSELGFLLSGVNHPIVPVLLGDALLSKEFAKRLQANGIFVQSFSYPVVPEGKARIRVQLSSLHTKEDIEEAVTAFKKVKEELIK